MKRLTDKQLVLFPVVEREIFYEEEKVMEHGLFGPMKTEVLRKPIPRFRAVVDVERDRVFSVVTENYVLVSNEKALALGEECFKVLFHAADIADMQVYNIVMPSTRSFCHVDLIHQKYRVDVWEQDTWLPYIRVTNSYNRTKPLTFDLGFVRSACSNGVIFEQQTVTIRCYHSDLNPFLEKGFVSKLGDLRELEASFIENMHNLKRFYVPRNVVFPLVCHAFGLPSPLRPDRTAGQEKFLADFAGAVAKLRDKYFAELGDNAYAAFNVLTDLATRPDVFPSEESVVHSFQKKSGAWIREFTTAIEQRSFSFESYLGPYAKLIA